MLDSDALALFARFGIPGLAIFVFCMLFQNKFDFKTSRLTRRSTAIIAVLFLMLATFVIVTALFLYKPTATTQEKQTIELLELTFDRHFIDKYSFVYSVIRPEKGLPRVQELGTWYRLVLNNQSKGKISVTDLRLVFDGKFTANDRIQEPFFEKINYSDEDMLLLRPLAYPIELEEKQYKAIYVPLPLTLPQVLGECALQAMRDESSPLDSMIEVFLFGEKPVHHFSPIVTIQSDNEEQLVSGNIFASIQIGDLSLYRKRKFQLEKSGYKMLGNYENDDGLRSIQTTDLFSTCISTAKLDLDSLRSLERPVNKAVLIAKISSSKEFSIALKPSPSLFYFIQDTQ